MRNRLLEPSAEWGTPTRASHRDALLLTIIAFVLALAHSPSPSLLSMSFVGRTGLRALATAMCARSLSTPMPTPNSRSRRCVLNIGALLRQTG